MGNPGCGERGFRADWNVSVTSSCCPVHSNTVYGQKTETNACETEELIYRKGGSADQSRCCREERIEAQVVTKRSVCGFLPKATKGWLSAEQKARWSWSLAGRWAARPGLARIGRRNGKQDGGKLGMEGVLRHWRVPRHFSRCVRAPSYFVSYFACLSKSKRKAPRFIKGQDAATLQPYLCIIEPCFQRSWLLQQPSLLERLLHAHHHSFLLLLLLLEFTLFI